MSGMTDMARVALSSLAAFLFAYLSMPFFRALAIRFGIIDFPGERKMHQIATPLMGGAAIYFGLIVGLLLNAQFGRDVLAILIGATIIFLLGVADDMKGLSARFRIAVQLVAALIVVMWGERISFLPAGAINDIIEILISLVWVIGITNAINYLDGLDGLATGSAVINLICFGGILYRTGQPALFGVSFIMAAACLGFLPHNFSQQKKKVFLGDAGSTLIGFVLASVGLCGYWAAGDPVRIAIPILILGVPIFDMTFTTIMRIAEGKIRNVYEWLKYAGRDHFHHYLVDLGLSSRGSVIFIYFTQVALGISAMIASVVGPITALLSVFQGIMIFAIIGILIVMGKRRYEDKKAR